PLSISTLFPYTTLFRSIQFRLGEDSLFINEAATNKNTTICFDSESFTYSKAKTTYKDWLKLKQNRRTVISYFKGFDKFQLSLFRSEEHTSELQSRENLV